MESYLCLAWSILDLLISLLNISSMRDTAAFQNASQTMSNPRGSNNYVSHHIRCGQAYWIAWNIINIMVEAVKRDLAHIIKFSRIS